MSKGIYSYSLTDSYWVQLKGLVSVVLITGMLSVGATVCVARPVLTQMESPVSYYTSSKVYQSGQPAAAPISMQSAVGYSCSSNRSAAQYVAAPVSFSAGSVISGRHAAYAVRELPTTKKPTSLQFTALSSNVASSAQVFYQTNIGGEAASASGTGPLRGKVKPGGDDSDTPAPVAPLADGLLLLILFSTLYLTLRKRKECL